MVFSPSRVSLLCCLVCGLTPPPPLPILLDFATTRYRWIKVPSHVEVPGNEGVDALAEMGQKWGPLNVHKGVQVQQIGTPFAESGCAHHLLTLCQIVRASVELKSRIEAHGMQSNRNNQGAAASKCVAPRGVRLVWGLYGGGGGASLTQTQHLCVGHLRARKQTKLTRRTVTSHSS